MFENIIKIFKRSKKKELMKPCSKDAAKERLHLVLMQDRANVSADFLDLIRKEIVEVIKKYIEVDEDSIDVRLTNETNENGEIGAPALYANIPIINIKDETRKLSKTNQENKINIEPPKEEVKSDNNEENKTNKQTKEAKTTQKDSKKTIKKGTKKETNKETKKETKTEKKEKESKEEPIEKNDKEKVEVKKEEKVKEADEKKPKVQEDNKIAETKKEETKEQPNQEENKDIEKEEKKDEK